MLAIKINIVLEININSWQKKRYRWPQNSFIILPIKVTFHFKISWLATLQFKEVLIENKERKNLRGSGEMKRQVEVYENLRLGDYLLIKFKKLSTFKILWLVYEFFNLCSGQLWLLLQLIVYRIIMERDRINIFWVNWRQVQGKLVSSTFDKKEWYLIYHSVFLPGFKVQYCLLWWKLSSCYYF